MLKIKKSWSWSKFIFKNLRKLSGTGTRYLPEPIYSFFPFIFQFFPLGSGSRRENECGSGSTALLHTALFSNSLFFLSIYFSDVLFSTFSLLCFFSLFLPPARHVLFLLLNIRRSLFPFTVLVIDFDPDPAFTRLLQFISLYVQYLWVVVLHGRRCGHSENILVDILSSFCSSLSVL